MELNIGKIVVGLIIACVVLTMLIQIISYSSAYFKDTIEKRRDIRQEQNQSVLYNDYGIEKSTLVLKQKQIYNK